MTLTLLPNWKFNTTDKQLIAALSIAAVGKLSKCTRFLLQCNE